MRCLPLAVSLFTLLLFIFSLTGNVLIADPAFSSVAFAQKKDKDDGKIKLKKGPKKNSESDGDKDNDNNGIPGKITALQAELDALEQELANIELTPGPPGEPGAPGTDGTNGLNGEPGPQGEPGTDGTNGTNGIDGVNGTNGANGLDGAPGTNGANGTDGINGTNGTDGLDGAPGPAGPTGAEISGRLSPCIPTGGLGMMAHIPGRSFSVRLPFDGSFVFSHIPAGTHTIVFELNGNVIGTLPGVVAVEGQVTNIGTFVTAFCAGDADGDGFTGAQGDCDNGDASINPSATEVCDGVDNNCDGQVDENCQSAQCQVSDWSAWSVCSVTCGGGTRTRTRTITVLPENNGRPCPSLAESSQCNTSLCLSDQDGDGWSPPQDCDDTNPNVNPSASEVCGDGIDNNCNGQVDENAVTATECSDACGNPYPQGTSCSVSGGPVDYCDGAGSCLPIIACPPGESICGGTSPTGCADLSTDNNNCGACGSVCLSGRSCQSGVCLP